jgi:hypothetical protein
VLKKMGEALELSPVQTEELLLAAALVIEDAVFEGRAPADIAAALPAALNKGLKQLVAAIVAKNLPKWRETVAAGQLSLPRLVDTDWRIDIKTSSDAMARMSQPAVLVDLRVRTGRPPRSSSIHACTQIHTHTHAHARVRVPWCAVPHALTHKHAHIRTLALCILMPWSVRVCVVCLSLPLSLGVFVYLSCWCPHMRMYVRNCLSNSLGVCLPLR